MSVTTHGVYLVTDEDECFLGRTKDILNGFNVEKFPGEGISYQSFLMDIVQGIVSDPIENSQTVTIEIRE